MTGRVSILSDCCSSEPLSCSDGAETSPKPPPPRISRNPGPLLHARLLLVLKARRPGLGNPGFGSLDAHLQKLTIVQY